MADFQFKVQALLDDSKLKQQLSGLGKTVDVQISKFTVDKSSLRTEIQSAMDSSNFTLKIGKVDISNFGTSLGRSGDSLGKLMADRIRTQLENGGIEAAIAKVNAQFERIGATDSQRLGSIRTELNNLISLHGQLSNSINNDDALVSTYEKFNTSLVKVKNSLTIVSSEAKATASSLQIGALDNKMQQWLANNGKAAQEYGFQVNLLRSRLADLGKSGNATTSDLKKIENEFKQIKIDAIAAGKAGQTFGEQLKGAFKQLTSLVSVAAVLRQGIKLFKDMAKEVLAVNTALTGLYRVTDLTASGYKQLYSQMVASAKEYGATLTDIIDGTTTWVKLGFDAATSQQLANITTMYQHVTDLDTSTAVDNLVTAYKGFQDQLLEVTGGDYAKAIEREADVFDLLGNKFAVTAADVGSGLTNSASALAVAGNSFEQSAAMLTGITEVTQNSLKAGTALRTLSMRLRGTSAKELQDLNESPYAVMYG